MALRKNDTAAATPAFEDMDGEATVVSDEAVAANEPTTEVKADDGHAEALKKVRSALAVTSPTQGGLQMQNALRRNTIMDDLQNVIGPDMLEGMGYNSFPRVTVSPGAFPDKSTGKSLGDKLKIQVMSWNFIHIVSANAGDSDKEANKLVRSSYDGVNLTGGQGTVEAYVRKLQADGYDKACSKKYVEIYGLILETGKGPVAEEDQKLTQLSIPPSSLGPWGAFLLGLRMSANKGKEITDVIVAEADSMSKGQNIWGVVAFKAA
jgi:hypothetical protein